MMEHLPLIFTPAYIQHYISTSPSSSSSVSSNNNTSTNNNNNANSNEANKSILGSSSPLQRRPFSGNQSPTTPLSKHITITNTTNKSPLRGGPGNTNTPRTTTKSSTNATSNTNTTTANTTLSTLTLFPLTTVLSPMDIINKIIPLYKRLHGITTDHGIQLLLLYIQSMKWYGAKYFPVSSHTILSSNTNTNTNTPHHQDSHGNKNSGNTSPDSSTEELILIITVKAIVFIHPQTLRIIMEFPFEQLLSFTHSFDSLLLIVPATTTATTTASSSLSSSTVESPENHTGVNKSSNNSNKTNGSISSSSMKIMKYYFQTTLGEEIESILLTYIQQYNPSLLETQHSRFIAATTSVPTNNNNPNTTTTLSSSSSAATSHN